MKVIVPKKTLYKPGERQQPPQVVALLTGFFILIVLYSLTGCLGLGYKEEVPAKVTETARQTKATMRPRQRLIWSDEFGEVVGTPPDSTKWSPDVGGAGWGNKQLEYDTNNQNAYQDGQGNLVLEAKTSNSGKYQCWYGPCQYTSARLATQGHFSFTYGLIKAKIKIPSGQGLWPAIWMVGDDYKTVGWPACGEIDIMENIGKQPNMIHGSVHGSRLNDSGLFSLPRGNFSDKFHIFALEWGPDSLHFMVDEINYYTIYKTSFVDQNKWVFDQPFSIILDNAVGGHWPGNPTSATVFPQKMLVSYVRVYQYA